MKRPPSDIGKDPNEVKTLNFLSQRKRKNDRMKKGAEKQISEKHAASQNLETLQRNSKKNEKELSKGLLFREFLKEVLHLENQTIACWLFKVIFY